MHLANLKESLVAVSITSLLLVGCDAKVPFNTFSNSGSSTLRDQLVQNLANAIPRTALQGKGYEYTVNSAGSSDFSYSLEGAPSWLSIDSKTGKISGYPDEPQTVDGIKLVVAKGGDRKSSTSFSIQVSGDPLTNLAWHLGNTGQKSFALNAGTMGEDMKVKEALRLGYTGAGVKVAVSDTGLEIRHEDLKDNVSLATSKNYLTAAPYLGNDPSPTGAGGDHGTSVSGIIGAKAWNGIGGRGIAPEVTLSGLNFLANPNGAGVFIDQITGDYDAFNQSWGSGFDETDAIFYAGAPATYIAQMRATALSGRSGKGAIIVRAAGNDYQLRGTTVGNMTVYRQRPANGELENAVPWSIVVGAMNAKGVRASYSSTGSSLWVSGLAGEFGRTDPAMITTDVMGCDKGYSRTGLAMPANTFETGTNNVDCKYTSIFNGTSSATPSVVGVVALMLQANPKLTFRDVKHILAKTATKVHANYTPAQFPLDPVGYFSEPGWITNAAGFNFHNWYGFGRVNAQAAVEMAKNYTGSLGTLLETVNNNGTWKYNKNVNLAIANNNVTTPTSVDTIAVTENYAIEAVQVELTITHPNVGEVGVELVGPSGTKSVLFNTNNALNTANFNQVIFLSNAFYGELSAGNWQIRVLDGSATAAGGTMTNWKINILGHAP